MSRDGIDEQFWGAGSYSFIADIHYFLQHTGNPVLVYRLLTVLFTALTAYLFYRILTRLNLLTPYKRLLTVVFFLINPFFSAKITMICFPYTLSLSFFTAAFYLFIITVEGNQNQYRFFSLLLFFVSFIANSLLFFYLIVPLYLGKDFANGKVKEIGRRLLTYSDFLILPVLFWSLKLLLFQPQGLYKLGGYNKISLQGFLTSPFHLFISIGSLIRGFIQPFFENPQYIILVALLLIVALLFPNEFTEDGYSKKGVNLFLLAVFLSLIAIYPYSLVGKQTSFHSYDTRNQLLLPFGFSILAVSLLGFVKNRFAQRYLSIILIAVLTYFNLQQQFHYLVGWFKQESIISNFQLPIFSSEINTIDVEDHTQKYNATDEAIMFFEWNGMAKYVLRDEKRFFMTPDLLALVPPNISMNDYVIFFRKNKAAIDHNLSTYSPNGDCHRMLVSYTNLNLDRWTSVVDLTWKNYFEKKTFKTSVRRYVEIQFDKECNKKLKSIL